MESKGDAKSTATSNGSATSAPPSTLDGADSRLATSSSSAEMKGKMPPDGLAPKSPTTTSYAASTITNGSASSTTPTRPDSDDDSEDGTSSSSSAASTEHANSASSSSEDVVAALPPPAPTTTMATPSQSHPPLSRQHAPENVRKLSAAEMQELTSAPESLPIGAAPINSSGAAITPGTARRWNSDYPLSAGLPDSYGARMFVSERDLQYSGHQQHGHGQGYGFPAPIQPASSGQAVPRNALSTGFNVRSAGDAALRRPPGSPRGLSTPPDTRRSVATLGQPPQHQLHSGRRNSLNPGARPMGGMGGFAAGTEGGLTGSQHRANTPKPISVVPLPPLQQVTGGEGEHVEQQQQQQGPQAQLGQAGGAVPSVAPQLIPLPPFSIPTHLQLELAAQRPSPLYIASGYGADAPYESSTVKFERLLNVLLLPSYFEMTMTFGTLACLDAWLYTFTILPIRFCIALGILVGWWGGLLAKEVRWVVGFVWYGVGRVWRRGRARAGSSRGRSKSDVSTTTEASAASRAASRSHSAARDFQSGQPQQQRPPFQATVEDVHANGTTTPTPEGRGRPGMNGSRESHTTKRESHHRSGHGSSAGGSTVFGHRRTKSQPSTLSSFHKADLLQGGVILLSSLVLMRLDASRMYHFIRAQSAIKLYVIYNALEVGDRLLSALGQDIIECLLCSETLSRNAQGRSRILLPLGMFALALIYNVVHSVCLFYQVITLNVAVNSYSNALLTLLMSNQFVEIKSTVFKRFEKENLFQLTCADIVERFQLWVMIIIISMRNVVEVGGLFVPGTGIDLLGGSGVGDVGESLGSGGSGAGGGGSGGLSGGSGPLHIASILPASFTILPSWLWSGEVLSPFLIVIGSEVIVDWIKHAYVTKFNNVRPTFYSRIMDVLCKDYYTNAFVSPSLTRRLGLPLLPLSCLFIRACVQTYHMFLASYVPMPVPPSTLTSLATAADDVAGSPSPAITASLEHLDKLIKGALGRSIYGDPYANATTGSGRVGAGGGTGNKGVSHWPWRWSSDDVVAAGTMLVVFFLVFLLALALKLVLGMVLLRISRDRYAAMRAKEAAVAKGQQEREVYDARGSRRIGGYGKVEVGDERRRWIYEDDADGLRKARERERKTFGDGPGGVGKGAEASGGSGGPQAGGGGAGRGEKEIDWNSIVRYEMINKRIW